MKKICIQCGKEFDMSEAELAFYEDKNLEVPKRCYRCRQSNRIRRYDAVVPRGIGKKGKNYFGIGRAMPGAFAILLMVAALIFGRSLLTPGDPSGNRTPSSGAGIEGMQFDGNVEARVFRNFDLLAQHYEKHGKSMGFGSAEEYLAAANAVVASPEALHKVEKEDGDAVYYLESSNDLVIVSTDGYIRTYFRPEDGKGYYERQ